MTSTCSDSSLSRSDTDSYTSSSDGKTIFFCLPTEPYGVLSQWYESEFEVEGVVYPTAEAWMMMHKAKLFGDDEMLKAMMRAKTPAEHQELGRKTRGFDRKVWDLHKDKIVEEGNFHKFTKSGDSAAMTKVLLDTGDKELVEASSESRIWSVGYDKPVAEENRDDWGENRMGEVLMRVRTRLREEGRQGRN